MTGNVSSLPCVAGLPAHTVALSVFCLSTENWVTISCSCLHLLLFLGNLLRPLSPHGHCYNSGLLVQPDPGPSLLHDFKHEALHLWLFLPLPPTSPLFIFTSFYPCLALQEFNCPYSFSQGGKQICGSPQMLKPESEVKEDISGSRARLSRILGAEVLFSDKGWLYLWPPPFFPTPYLLPLKFGSRSKRAGCF